VLNDAITISFELCVSAVWLLSQVSDDDDDDDRTDSSHLELSFEYLVAKNSLRWITLYTSQVTQRRYLS